MSSKIVLNEDTAPPGVSGKVVIYMDNSDSKLYANTDNIGPVELGGTAIESGASFPGSPDTGDYFFRTDLGRLFRYNGADWDTTELWIEEGTAPSGVVGKTVIYHDTADNKLKANVNNSGAQEIALGDIAPNFAPNIVINGSFAIDQRGDGASTEYSDDEYCLDRWYVLTESNPIDVDQIDGDSQRYALRMTQKNASAQQIALCQIIEGVNCRHLRGQDVVLSMRLRMTGGTGGVRIAVLEWTGTEDSVTSDVILSWSGPLYVANAGLPLGATYGSVFASSTWSDVEFTATLGTSFTNLVIIVLPVNDMAQNVTLDIEAVQLERNESATTFHPRSVAQELMLCQYYYASSGGEQAYQQFGTGVARSSTQAYVILTYSAMRVAPSLSVSNTSHFQAYHPGVAGPVATAMTFHHITSESCQLEVDYASTGSTGSAIQIRAANTTDARLIRDAEI